MSSTPTIMLSLLATTLTHPSAGVSADAPRRSIEARPSEVPAIVAKYVGARQSAPQAGRPVPAMATGATAGLALPGRESDALVARIAFRLADAGRARCPVVEAGFGLVLQHLSQFHLADRAGMIAARSLDRGPGVIAVVPGGPAFAAGIRAGDVLVAIDGVALPPEPGFADSFDAPRAHARADAVHALLIRAGDAPVLTMLRDGTSVEARVATRPICPSRVHLARSDQRNAYADGRRVLLTTGLVARLRGDDELAFVVAHEMAHNILGHAAILRGGEVAHGIGRTLGRSGQIVRRTEREADMLAGELMLDAGFDPVAGAQALRRLGGTDLALFADHASVGDRIAAMTTLVEARGAR